MSASASAVDALCNGGNGSVDLAVSGGTAPYSYSWSNGASSQDLASVGAGSYTATVTDDNGCTANANATVNEPSAISASTVDTDASCNGGNDGAIDLNVSGGTAPYTYSWSNGATSQDISGLTAGSYTVTITDDNGCTAGSGGTVGEPSELVLGSSATDVSCNGGNDGSVDLSVSGGTAPYSYSWSNGATSQDISGLTAGSYTATVTDANGCSANEVASVNEPSALSLSISGTDESAPSAGDGAADLTVGGGTAPYSYLWSNGATTEDISGLNGGTYSVTVTDANGCTASDNVTVNTLVLPLAVSITASSDVSCNGGNDGSATAAGSGGNPPYSYNWSNGATTATASGLAAGNYTVTVTDALSATASTSVTISEPSALSASASASDVSCNGDTDGSVDLTVGGGTAPYSYSWSNGASTEDISGLGAGKLYSYCNRRQWLYSCRKRHSK